MFTGIVEACVPVRRVEPLGTGLTLFLGTEGLEGWELELGQSVAVSGVCLTVARLEGTEVAFELSAETLARTWFGELASAGLDGRRVNLERAMRIGDRLDGHLVAGHVDGGGTIVGVEDSGDEGRVFTFEVDPGLDRYLIEKGSVSLDGISLTVVRPRGRRFDVAVIPRTLEWTSLGTAELGQRVNVEADMIGKWVERLSSFGCIRDEEE
jgi:riboflavin synthase